MEIDLTDSPSATSVSTPTDGGLHLHKRRRTDDPVSDRDDIGLRTDPEGDDSSHIHHLPLNVGSATNNNNSGAESTRTAVVLSEPPQWQRVIEKAVKAIVSIRFSQVSAFDTEGNYNSSFSVLCLFDACVLIIQAGRRGRRGRRGACDQQHHIASFCLLLWQSWKLHRLG